MSDDLNAPLDRDSIRRRIVRLARGEDRRDAGSAIGDCTERFFAGRPT